MEKQNSPKETKTTYINALDALTKKKGYDKMPKEIRDRIAYTLKKFGENAKNVTMATLKELTDDVKATLDAMKAANAAAKEAAKTKAAPTPAPVAAAVEASPKKLQKPVKTAPKPEPKKPEVVAAPAGTKAEFSVAKYFPDEIEVPEYGKLAKVPATKFKDFNALREFLNKNGTVYITCYWTKRHIKEYAYGPTRQVTPPKEFPLDLDVLTPIAVCDKVDRVWAMSVYTEGVFNFEAPDFEPVEDTDAKTGEKFLVKVSAGLEFELYMPTK